MFHQSDKFLIELPSRWKDFFWLWLCGFQSTVAWLCSYGLVLWNITIARACYRVKLLSPWCPGTRKGMSVITDFSLCVPSGLPVHGMVPLQLRTGLPLNQWSLEIASQASAVVCLINFPKHLNPVKLRPRWILSGCPVYVLLVISYVFSQNAEDTVLEFGSFRVKAAILNSSACGTPCWMLHVHLKECFLCNLGWSVP